MDYIHKVIFECFTTQASTHLLTNILTHCWCCLQEQISAHYLAQSLT